MRELLAGIIWGIAAAVSVAGSPASAVVAAYADCEKLPADIAQHASYLWLGDLPEKDWPQFKQQLRYKLNTVSTEADVVQIYDVAPDLIRFDRRDPGPAFAVAWEATAEPGIDPVFHLTVQVEEVQEIGHYTNPKEKTGWVTTRKEPTGKKTKKSVMAAREIEDCPSCRGWLPSAETAGLLLLTQTRSPILSGLWWWARASREIPLNNKVDGTGYLDWIGVKSRADFFKIMRIHEEDHVRIIRGVVERGESGVAQNGRQMERGDGTFGGYWFTLDVDGTDGDQSVTQQLKRGDLRHQAEEYYATGANRLPFLLLCQADGTVQNTAPDFIGGNGDPGYGGVDFRIHVGTLSCADCHGIAVLKAPKKEFVRANFDGPQHLLQSPDYKVEKAFNQEFFSSLEKQRARDANVFIEAMQDISGLKIDKLVDAEDHSWLVYANTPLDAAAYGRLLGVDEKTLVVALKSVNDKAHGIHPVLFPLLRGGAINRSSAEEFVPVAQAYLRDYVP